MLTALEAIAASFSDNTKINLSDVILKMKLLEHRDKADNSSGKY